MWLAKLTVIAAFRLSRKIRLLYGLGKKKKLRLATAAWGLISASVRDSSGECIFEGILMKKKIMGAALLPRPKNGLQG